VVVGEEHGWHSPALDRWIGLRVYGQSGRPIVAFPPQDGSHTDFESFGMVASVEHLIDDGRITIVSVDTVDAESWTHQSLPIADRVRRYEAYDRYLTSELVPWLRQRTSAPSIWTTGCSMGAYHAANAFFRHPDLFDGVVAISGLYQLTDFVGQTDDPGVHRNSPLRYVPDVEDPWHLDRYRAASICFVCGQGAWEDGMLADTRAMAEVLAAKAVPAIVDIWGYDVNHDWPWWQKMLPYELERMGV
jgi:esterase/lipase superfamily enzyme